MTMPKVVALLNVWFLLLCFALADGAVFVLTEKVDGYRVRMKTSSGQSPVVGKNEVTFELKAPTGRDVDDVDVGVTYAISGNMGQMASFVKSGSLYTGNLIFNTAASWDVFFVFEVRGQPQRVVRFTFEVR
ncbi:MAG: hypothetical protein HQL05_12960 [Nitrospirae bacterium]|uniref:hypothetical protein n=1 Tax=Candidatus Magnetobacterium casense TaxID=1455061 RepID=UPI00058E2D64|nr:hypothetical protein [Candidatus Magnetobacterium casensis]MBF0338725.1 hypothetical protein [Nitrospirota bacterium]